MQIVSLGDETICIKCHILFSGKNKKNIINLSSAENAQREVKVKKTFQHDRVVTHDIWTS